MKPKYILAVLLTIFIFFAGCKDQIVTEDNFNNNQTGPLSKFSEIQNNIFAKNCALSGCHAGSSPQANLNLSTGSAYAQLVNVNSFLFPGQKRIVPGNKDASILFKALNYNFQLKMPPTGKLDQSIIDSIGVWIQKGAPND